MRLLPNSLLQRLIVASLILLPLFFGLTGLAVLSAFRDSSETAKHEQLRLQSYILLSAAEWLSDGLWLPQTLREARFGQLQSGLYGLVSDAQGRILWRSPSAQDLALAALPAQPGNRPGREYFEKLAQPMALYRYSYPVLWQRDNGDSELLIFSVLEDQQPTQAQIAEFRRVLLQWLSLAGIALLATLLLILRWGTRPLRALAAELKQIEQGESRQLQQSYPQELQPLCDNLNQLLHSEQLQRERYRTTLADLAHSLKTPLAVMRGELDGHASPPLLGDQLARMEEIVSHQLQRAVIGAQHQLRGGCEIAPAAAKLQRALAKVYRDKALDIQLAIAPALRFAGDERDLLEVLGNLLDNACKAARTRISVRAESRARALWLTIEDDGAGIAAAQRQAILQRGARADSQHPGQGIGLAVVVDIVDSYGGRIEIDRSEALGGARFQLQFPQR